MWSFRRLIWPFILLSFIGSGALADQARLAIAPAEFNSTLQALLHDARESSAVIATRSSLDTLYKERNYAPLWLPDLQMSPQARAILDVMRKADQDGLEPNEYRAADIELEYRSLATAPDKQRQAARIELSISTQLLKFISHLHFGRISPASVGFDLPTRSGAFDPIAVIKRVAAAEDPVEEFAAIEPPFQHYAFLKQALAHYRELAARVESPKLAILKKSVKPGENYDDAPKLREFLFALGDLPEASAQSTSLALDDDLVTALKRFQFRHGLTQDGALGAKTLAALTTPLSKRVRQIELTLERWRWLPQFDGPTIIVNIPQFRLFAFSSNDDRESHMLTMNVIVGKTFPRNRTPVFAADMKYVVFRPYWDVPYQIMMKEMLSHIRKDPGYLQKENMELVSKGEVVPEQVSEIVSALTNGQLRVRQRPGNDNALGLIKFALPNRYDVYLHSTPFKELFRESRRAFSHGCIRVSNPIGLAEYVLKNADAPWSREQIEDAMNGEDNRRVELQHWVRVLIVYGTAVATESGAVYFFDDLYGNDARLDGLLKMPQSRVP